MDDFELEVAPLGRDEAEVDSAVSAGLERAVPGARHTVRGRRNVRRVGAMAAVLAVVLTGALLIAITPGSRGELGTLVFGTPTPTVPLPFGADVLYFEHAVPWASSNPTVDGKPIALNLKSNSVTFVRVARGRHTLAYDAPPFAPLRCVFSVPAAKGDTCQLGEQDDLNLPGTVKLARVIDLGGIPTKLPADQLAALDAAVRAMVDLPQRAASLRVGERYVTDAGVQTATQPLSATLIFELARDASAGCDVIERCDGNCEYLCVPANAGTDADSIVGDAPSGWFLVSHIESGWRYTTSDGTPITSDLVPLLPATAQLLGQPSTSPMSAMWDGKWEVSGELGGVQIASVDNPTCDVGEVVSVLLPQSTSGDTFFASDVTASLPNPSDGCVVRVVQFGDQTGDRLASAALLYRFGVLLTLDETGHTLLPSLSQADAYEQALAAPVVAALPPLTSVPQA